MIAGQPTDFCKIFIEGRRQAAARAKKRKCDLGFKKKCLFLGVVIAKYGDMNLCLCHSFSLSMYVAYTYSSVDKTFT